MSYLSMKKYEVYCDNLKEFCERYHRRGAYQERGEEYMEYDYEDHKKDMEKDGYTIIPQGLSTTGYIVSYYGKI